jgi:N-acetylmuramoyl-L-alanine amidase
VLGLVLNMAALAMGCSHDSRSRASADPTVTVTRLANPSPSSTSTVQLSPTPSPTGTFTATPSGTPTPTFTPTALPPLVAIDPGHGGRDYGGRHFDADGHMDISEKEINLVIALKAAEQVRAAGFRVILTRDGDYRLNSEARLDLNEDGEVDSADEVLARADLVNNAGADLLLSIHQNAYYGDDAQEVGGTQTLYCAERSFGEANQRFAQLVHEQTLTALGEVGYAVRDRGVLRDEHINVPDAKGKHLLLLGPKTDRITIPSQMPGVLSETLFVTNDVEAELLQRADVQDALARAYAAAISAYFQGQ